jgi:hypothetical protein
MYTVMSSPSISTFIFFGTFSIHMPYLCMYSIWFVSWTGQRQTWMKLIYYSTTPTRRQHIPRKHWKLPTNLHVSENHKLNAHYHENLKSHTRKKVTLLYWSTWRKSQDKPTKLSSQNLPAETWSTLFFKPIYKNLKVCK